MLILVVGLFALVTSAPAQTGLRGGEELFRSACAGCHGADGTGLPQVQLGFDTPMPDFTDCSFASREPDADWFDGGLFDGW